MGVIGRRDPIRSANNKRRRTAFWILLILSFILSVIVAISFLHIPTVSSEQEKVATTEIPAELISELEDVSRHDYVYLSQHGYKHEANIPPSEIMAGYEILTGYGLDITYYTPPLEDEVIGDTPVPVFRSKFSLREDESYDTAYRPRALSFDEGTASIAETGYNETKKESMRIDYITITTRYNVTDKNHNTFEFEGKEYTVELPDGTCWEYCSVEEAHESDPPFTLNCVQPPNVSCPYNMIEHEEEVSDALIYKINNYESDKVAVIHIQDDITKDYLEKIFEAAPEVSILRIDDINTNFVEGYGQMMRSKETRIDRILGIFTGNMVSAMETENEVKIKDQIKRIDVATKFCKDRGCTLVLTIIPYVLRPTSGDRGAGVFSKITAIFTIITLLPLYLFYLLSYVIFKGKAREELEELQKHKKPPKRTSVILPVFNEEGIIFSVLKNNIRVFETSDLNITEVIVVDDCSSDNSVKEVERFEKSYRGKMKIKIVRHKHNQGKSQAMKTGLKYTKSEYVLLTDSDSYFEKDALRRVYASMNGHTSIVGYIMPQETNALSKMQAVEYDFDQKILRNIQLTYNNPISIPGPFYVVKREFLSQVKFTDSIVEDFKIGMELNRQNKKIAVCEGRTLTHPPLNLRTLRKQRLRWFGGILHESLMNRDVWRNNGFYRINCMMSIGSFFFVVFSLVAFIASLALASNRMLHMFNIIIFFVGFNLIIGLMHLFVTRRWNLKLLLLYPYYLLFLFIIRTEVIFRLLLGYKFQWGTRGSKRIYI